MTRLKERTGGSDSLIAPGATGGLPASVFIPTSYRPEHWRASRQWHPETASYQCHPPFDAAGNLYAAIDGGGSNNIIEKFTPGGVGTVFATFTGPSRRVGLAFDAAGNLYAASDLDNSVFKFTPGGVGSVFANSGLSTPIGLAFDATSNLYVSNLVGAITRFTPGGVGSAFGPATGGYYLAFQQPTAVPEPGVADADRPGWPDPPCPRRRRRGRVAGAKSSCPGRKAPPNAAPQRTTAAGRR